MTSDDIIRMAREAGFSLKNFAEPPKPYIHVSGYGDTLERFAAVVAAAEREAILQMSENQWYISQKSFENAIRERGNT
jgi:hypothetical protein